MRLGNNEKTILAILKNHNDLTEKQLNIAFKIITKKNGRIDTILHSLRVKGFISDSEDYSVDLNILQDITLPEISLDRKLIQELESLDDVKIGRLGKSIIYTLEKTDKASLQFLSTFFKKPTRNIYAILQRLEEKGMLVSYNATIRRVNSAGRRYHPKYYVLTKQGKGWLESNIEDIKDKKQIDTALKKTEEQIQEYSLRI